MINEIRNVIRPAVCSGYNPDTVLLVTGLELGLGLNVLMSNSKFNNSVVHEIHAEPHFSFTHCVHA